MLVSVYLPTRNRLELLRKAVASVLAQRYRALELIVVDDASSDGTPAFLQAVAERDGRVRLHVNESPRGAPAARNLAIRSARGDFVTGLDDDDEFHPERVRTFIEYWTLLTSTGLRPSCLYAQDFIRIDGEDAGITRKLGSVNADDLFESNCVGNQIFAPKAHFIEAGLFDEALPAWQDLELFMRLFRRFGTGYLLDIPTYVFNLSMRPDRISAQSGKVRRAFEMVHRKHADGQSRRKQELFLQMFKAYYGTRPTALDWLKFLRWGIWPEGVRRLIRSGR